MAQDKTANLVIRLTPGQLAAFQAEADRQGQTVSAWARDHLDEVLARASKDRNLVRVGGRVVEWDRTL